MQGNWPKPKPVDSNPAQVGLRFTYDAMPYSYNENLTIAEFTVDSAVETQYAASSTLPEWIMIVVMRAMWEKHMKMFVAWDAWLDLPFQERDKTTQPPQPSTGDWSVGFRFYPNNNINQWTLRGELQASPRPSLFQQSGQPFVREVRFKVFFPNGKCFIVSAGNIEEVPFRDPPIDK